MQIKKNKQEKNYSLYLITFGFSISKYIKFVFQKVLLLNNFFYYLYIILQQNYKAVFYLLVLYFGLYISITLGI